MEETRQTKAGAGIMRASVTESQAGVTASADCAAWGSSVKQRLLRGGETEPYVVLDETRPDGRYKLPDVTRLPVFSNRVSDENGKFAAPVIYTLSFSAPRSVDRVYFIADPGLQQGLTEGELEITFTATADAADASGSTPLGAPEIVGNTARYTIMPKKPILNTVFGLDKAYTATSVRLKITGWSLPNAPAKVSYLHVQAMGVNDAAVLQLTESATGSGRATLRGAGKAQANGAVFSYEHKGQTAARNVTALTENQDTIQIQFQ